MYTLLLINSLPFLFFGIHTQYWYRPKAAFLPLLGLGAISAFALLYIAAAIFRDYSVSTVDEVVLLVLHALPALLTLLMIWRLRDFVPMSRFKLEEFHRNEALKKVRVKEGAEGGGTKHKDEADREDNEYKPVAKQDKIKTASWEDIIINSDLREELESVISLLKDPGAAKEYGIEVPKGILFQGPPGTGKTSLAKVVAGTAGLNFFVLRADEITSKWVGESEKNLTKFFETAQQNAPAIIFIDEVDSIGGKRSGEGNSHKDNLLNHMLQLIDGVIDCDGIYIIAATNRAELVDEALKRPGRLNKVVEIALPDLNSRRRIFELNLAKRKFAAHEINLDFIAKQSAGCSGAVIEAICNEAALRAFRRESKKSVEMRDPSIRSSDLLASLEEFLSQMKISIQAKRAAGSVF